MEFKSSNINKLHYNERKFLLIKLPADVLNPQNAIEALGGKDKIFDKVNYVNISTLMMKILSLKIFL